jgi:DNA-binding CsgD family transcriptional regulator
MDTQKNHPIVEPSPAPTASRQPQAIRRLYGIERPQPSQFLAVADALPGACAIVLDRSMTILGGTDRWFRTHDAQANSVVGQSLRTVLSTVAGEERIELARRAFDGAGPVVIRGIRDGVHEMIVAMETSDGGAERLLWMEQLANGAPVGDAEMRVAYPEHHTWGAIKALTPKQLDILRMVGMGLENDRIADLTNLSRRTVEWHMQGLYESLGVAGRAELARLSLRAGLPVFPPDAWHRMLRAPERLRARQASV